MKILAIETATLTGSVALLSDEAVLGEITLSVSVQHSERLMPAIEQLLRDASLSSKDVDLYAVSAGPGSFTGLRIGIAAAQGLSLAHGKTVVGVSTLEALAMNGRYFPGLVVPMLNAFRGEVYWRSDGEDRVSGPDDLLVHLKSQSERILLVGNGIDICGSKITDGMGEGRVELIPAYLRSPRALHVAALAAEKFKKGLSSEPVRPRYLRKPG